MFYSRTTKAASKRRRFWANCFLLDQNINKLFGAANLASGSKRKRVIKLAAEFETRARIFDTALSSSPNFHYIFDTNHRFTLVSQALLKLCGLTLEQAIGKNFGDLGYSTELIILHHDQLNEVLKGRTIKGENAYSNSDGAELPGTMNIFLLQSLRSLEKFVQYQARLAI